MILTIVIFTLLNLLPVPASAQKLTPVSVARAAIEANLKTAEGKAYDKQMGQEIMQRYASGMRNCKQTAGGGLESFWILMKLDKEGLVKELLLAPETEIGQCDREIFSKAKFSPPPRNDYWVGIFLKLSR